MRLAFGRRKRALPQAMGFGVVGFWFRVLAFNFSARGLGHGACSRF